MVVNDPREMFVEKNKTHTISSYDVPEYRVESNGS